MLGFFMNENSVIAGNKGVQIFLKYCELLNWKAELASELEDQTYGFDVKVYTGTHTLYVDVKNYSHNICGKLMFDPMRFSVRHPFRGGCMATHLFIADTETLITVYDYISQFLIESQNVYKLINLLGELEKKPFEKAQQSYDYHQINVIVMPIKEKINQLLKPQYDFWYDQLEGDPNQGVWRRKVYDEKENKHYRDYRSNQITFKLKKLDKPRAVPSLEGIDCASEFLNKRKNKGEDVS